MKFGERRAALSEAVSTARSTGSAIRFGVVLALVVSVLALVVSLVRGRP